MSGQNKMKRSGLVLFVFLFAFTLLSFVSHPYTEKEVYEAPFLDPYTNTLIEEAKESYKVSFGLILSYEFMAEDDKLALDKKEEHNLVRGISSYSKSLFFNRYRLSDRKIYEGKPLPMVLYLKNELYETKVSVISIDGDLKGTSFEKKVSDDFKNMVFICFVFSWFFGWLRKNWFKKEI